MANRPILFSGPMVRAILAGRKTVTRRVMKPQPRAGWVHQGQNIFGQELFYPEDHLDAEKAYDRWDGLVGRPYAIGDRLWVRETWNVWFASRDGDDWWPARSIPKEDPRKDEDARAPSAVDYPVCSTNRGYDAGKGPWRPSIHMPRWASRITLPVIDVRAERLQDITEEDAKAEGARAAFSFPGWDGVSAQPCYRWGFHELWDDLAKPGARWDDNPWVWRYEFPAQGGPQVKGDGE